MRPYLSALLALMLIPALLVACGDDDDDGNAAPGDETAAAGGDQTPGADDNGEPAESPTPTPETPVATPTRVADSDPLVVVSGPAGDLLQPTVADIDAMEQQTVSADGDEYSGVGLVDLGARVGASAEAMVTLEGIRSDGVRYSIVRFSLAEVGDDSVLYVGDSGHLNLASGTIAPANWLTAISSISYQ